MGTRNNVDLSLLSYFEALYSESNVSRAADRVNLSQPAMSLALKRLREMFDDPLFVQTSAGMMPTARASELVGPVRSLLQQSRELLEVGREFDPTTLSNPLHIVAPEYVGALVLPKIVGHLAKVAPNAKLGVRALAAGQLKKWFEEGEVGVGIGYAQRPPAELHSRPLLADKVVCIVREGHPVVQGELSVDNLLSLPYIEVLSIRKPRYAEILDEKLAEIGAVGRQPRITVTDPGTALAIVEVTDLMVVVPQLLARRYLQHGHVQALPLPIELPELTLSLLWHPRSHRDSLHRWFRATIVEACADLG